MFFPSYANNINFKKATTGYKALKIYVVRSLACICFEEKKETMKLISANV